MASKRVLSGDRTSATPGEDATPLIEINVFETKFSDQQRAGAIDAVTDAIVRFTGDSIRRHTWVVLEEITSGSRGIGGTAVGLPHRTGAAELNQGATMPNDKRHAIRPATVNGGPFEGLRTAAVDGAMLAYGEQGEGEPVAFVHGDCSDLRTWGQQLPAIGASYRAIAYSRRYARPNEDIEPDADDQMHGHVDDLAAFLREMGAAPAHVVGHSWGAFICLLAAIRQPRLVRSVVLAEPPVLSLFMSVLPRPTEILRLLRRPRTALAIFAFAARTGLPAE